MPVEFATASTSVFVTDLGPGEVFHLDLRVEASSRKQQQVLGTSVAAILVETSMPSEPINFELSCNGGEPDSGAAASPEATASPKALAIGANVGLNLADEYPFPFNVECRVLVGPIPEGVTEHVEIQWRASAVVNVGKKRWVDLSIEPV